MSGNKDSDPCCAIDLTTTKTTFNCKIKGLNNDTSAIYNLEGIRTKDFTMKIPGHRDSKWMMEIKPGTIVSAAGEYLPIWISLHSKNPGTINVQLIVYVSSSMEPLVRYKLDVNHTFIGESSCELDFGHGSSCYWSIVPGGQLEIVLDFIFPSSSTTLRSEALLLEDKRKKNQITRNFEQFFLSKEMSDIQIRCGDKTFDAHQVILSAWSPVFRGMFQAEMKEKETKTVEIQDLEPDIMLEMLKFIYIGRCGINNKNPDIVNVMGLLEAADRYQVDVLKAKCEEVMISILEPNNCLRILDCADMFGAQDLKTRAMKLVVRNMKTLLGSDEWKECAKKRPHLFVDISEALAKCM